MWGRTAYLAVLVAALFWLSDSAPVKKTPKTPNRLKKPPVTIQKFDPFVGVKDSGKVLFNAFSNNAIANVFKNTYSFFYWLPRRNIPFDTPWKLFGKLQRNSPRHCSECINPLFVVKSRFFLRKLLFRMDCLVSASTQPAPLHLSKRRPRAERFLLLGLTRYERSDMNAVI